MTHKLCDGRDFIFGDLGSPMSKILPGIDKIGAE